MTQQAQLVYCKKCLNRKMDLKLGIICNLTNKKADFKNECISFKKDEKVNDMTFDELADLPSDTIDEIIPPEVIEKLKTNQKFKPGITAGIIAGVVGAILWSVLTVITYAQVSFVALAIGAGVGLTIRKVGNGIDKKFGYWGAGIALLSILLGNVFSIVGLYAYFEDYGFFKALLKFEYFLIPYFMGDFFGLIDLVYYGVALYAGYKFSFRQVTEKDLKKAGFSL